MTEVPKGTNNDAGLTDLMILLRAAYKALALGVNAILLVHIVRLLYPSGSIAL